MLTDHIHYLNEFQFCVRVKQTGFFEGTSVIRYYPQLHSSKYEEAFRHLKVFAQTEVSENHIHEILALSRLLILDLGGRCWCSDTTIYNRGSCLNECCIIAVTLTTPFNHLNRGHRFPRLFYKIAQKQTARTETLHMLPNLQNSTTKTYAKTSEHV